MRHHPEGVDDDELAEALGLSSRQYANRLCRELEEEGLVIRRKVQGKIHNFWAGQADTISSSSELFTVPNAEASQPRAQPWFWEGNIQSRVVGHLVMQGYHIRSVADTASHQRGIDIIAEKVGEVLWVTVKGYPQGTEKTRSTVQAGHWFKQAVFDIIEYRGRDRNALLAVALPDFPRYRSLARKITWFKSVADFSYFWVGEDGHVLVE